eukprot:scaffold31613_cov45-Phaeocystis_antarctica.AAC.1
MSAASSADCGARSAGGEESLVRSLCGVGGALVGSGPQASTSELCGQAGSGLRVWCQDQDQGPWACWEGGAVGVLTIGAGEGARGGPPAFAPWTPSPWSLAPRSSPPRSSAP